MTVQTQETIYIEIFDACLRLARHTLNKCERTKALTGVSYWVIALLAKITSLGICVQTLSSTPRAGVIVDASGK